MTNGVDMHESEKKSTPRLVTRGQVAKMLRRTETQVRRYEERGRLRKIEVTVAGKRRIRYDPLEVAVLRDELAKRDADRKRTRAEAGAGWTEEEGKLSAAVFRLLSQDKTLREIVVELEVPPDVVRRLRAEYARTFEDDDRQRRAEGAARRERQDARDHARNSAVLAREERAARERRAARRAALASPVGAPTELLRSGSDSDTASEKVTDDA